MLKIGVEGWQSGLMRRTRNAVGEKSPHRFKSCTLRFYQIRDLVYNYSMPKIIQNIEGCIGCGSCAAVCPKFWDMDYEKGKAVLKGGKINAQGNESELEISGLPAGEAGEEDLKCNQEAAEVCPVAVIKIIKQ